MSPPTYLRALGASRKAERPPGKEGGNTLPSALPAQMSSGLTAFSPGSCSAPRRPARLWDGLLAQLSGSQYPRLVKQQGPSQETDLQAQREVTKQVRAKFKVLSTASGKRQDGLGRRKGGVEEVHPGHCCGSGHENRSILHWKLPGTPAGK